MLQLDEVSVSYGNIVALDRASLVIHEGEIVCLIGANGAGKTTLLKTIMGLAPGTGSIRYNDTELSTLSTPERITLGLALVPETREIFPKMTVKDNLALGTFLETNRSAIQTRLESVFNLFPRLKERLRQIAGTLSGGEQQMLALGRALMQNPKLLLLDEPSLGLAPNLTDDIFLKIREINAGGTTIFLVEQKARKVFHLAQRAYVLSVGKMIKEGRTSELIDDEVVRRAYLGA